MIILFFALHLCFTEAALIIQVDSESGSDSLNCLKGGSATCKSLGYIADNISPWPLVKKNRIVVSILSSQLDLKSVVEFFRVSEFAIKGSSPETVITCPLNSSYGIRFVKSSGVSLSNLSIKQCGAFSSNDFTQNDSHALLILESKNISIANISVIGSRGYGLSLININDSAHIENSTFQESRFKPHYHGGSGGLLIGVNSTMVDYSATYDIHHCMFQNNKANLQNSRWDNIANRGGGALIFLSNRTIDNVVRISHCLFHNNTAYFGAGLYLICHALCQRNNINIYEVDFHNNSAVTGGGGIDIGYSLHRHKWNQEVDHKPVDNIIVFHSCNIENNTGQFGGGVAIFTDLAFSLPNKKKHQQNKVSFTNCSFHRNKANGGAAVDISVAHKQTGFFISLNHFNDCTFKDNVAGYSATSNSSSQITRSGAFFTSKVYAYFNGKITFQNNQGTALYVSSTTVIFKNTEVIFKDNRGGISGGILLIGQAYLKLAEQNNLTFVNNRGTFGGGLSSFILETHYFQNTDNCFVEWFEEFKPWDNNFTFINNTATSEIAHDIFVSNLCPCLNYEININCSNMSNFFDEHHIGIFNFIPKQNLSYATATEAIKTINGEIKAFPGIKVILDVTQRDQFGQNVSKLFPLSPIIKDPTEITIDNNYAFVTESTVVLNGKPGENATLVLQSNIIVVVMVTLQVTMLECPPGFYYNESTKTCLCEPNKYITQCAGIQVSIKQGNWAGYVAASYHTFAIGACEYRLCKYNRTKLQFGTYRLPSERNELDAFVCGGNRAGVLCGACSANMTVYYNSPSFRCDSNQSASCDYGVVLYLLTEIVPVTILFLVIIIFNIHLTSGLLYSYIFYVQTLDFLYVNAFGAIQYTGFQKYVFDFYKIFYGMLNLKFFVAERLAFCFSFKNLNLHILDMFLIQYITVIYSLLLIFLTIIILKLNSLYSCIKLCHKCGRRNIRGSVINGLTAFVVLCYYKCVHLTCSILIPVHLHVIDNSNVHAKKVPLFNGELEYMSKEHLKYAIPAITCLFVIILPPPILLLFESVAMKLNRTFTMRRNRISYCLHILRMKTLPFLDSFQGCFKDNCRCFAGLFFVYKIVLICPYMFTGNISYDFMWSEVVLFGILALHIYCRPFQESWHNTLDAVLLVDLILVNLLTLNTYESILLVDQQSPMKEVFQGIQVLCIFLPSLYPCAILIIKISVRFNLKSYFSKRMVASARSSMVSRVLQSSFEDSSEASESLPFRMEHDCNSYHTFRTDSEDF